MKPFAENAFLQKNGKQRIGVCAAFDGTQERPDMCFHAGAWETSDQALPVFMRHSIFQQSILVSDHFFSNLFDAPIFQWIRILPA